MTTKWKGRKQSHEESAHTVGDWGNFAFVHVKSSTRHDEVHFLGSTTTSSMLFRNGCVHKWIQNPLPIVSGYVKHDRQWRWDVCNRQTEKLIIEHSLMAAKFYSSWLTSSSFLSVPSSMTQKVIDQPPYSSGMINGGSTTTTAGSFLPDVLFSNAQTCKSEMAAAVATCTIH